MKKLAISLILISVIFGCVAKKTKVNQHIVDEREFPEKVIDYYLDKSQLKQMTYGVDNFEVRRWSAFLPIDSFPFYLERYFLENENLITIIYIYSNKDGRQIQTKRDLDGMKVDTFEIVSPANYLDSLKGRYSIENIDTTNLLNLERKDVFWNTVTTHLTCYEQATSIDYWRFFISRPDLFDRKNKSIDQLLSIDEFMDRIQNRDPKKFQLIREKFANVFGYILPSLADSAQ